MQLFKVTYLPKRPAATWGMITQIFLATFSPIRLVSWDTSGSWARYFLGVAGFLASPSLVLVPLGVLLPASGHVPAYVCHLSYSGMVSGIIFFSFFLFFFYQKLLCT